MALPLVEGLTATERDAEPLVYRLADVIERNPALMLEGPDKLMEVVGKIAWPRANVADKVNESLALLGDAWSKSSDPEEQARVAGWIRDMRAEG